MSEPAEREARTAAAIDAANAEDPDTVVIDGEARPLQQALGRVAAEWVDRLDPSATAVQRLAARAHHLRRWERPRSAYPEGRAGYLRWRAAAKDRHAEDLGALLRQHGWSDDDVAGAQALLRKEGLGRVPATQVHEDAVCLAFLAVQLDAAVDLMGEAKTVEVLRRTARKMSPEALARAAELPYSPRGRALLERALAPDGG
ncbi:MAG TPA: DUF4202 domain-containing protein [Acidimicrobiales bacterium]|nr:DUF4202 domain-containing protein [Acidimicrobiales bacterium]